MKKPHGSRTTEATGKAHLRGKVGKNHPQCLPSTDSRVQALSEAAPARKVAFLMLSDRLITVSRRSRDTIRFDPTRLWLSLSFSGYQREHPPSL